MMTPEQAEEHLTFWRVVAYAKIESEGLTKKERRAAAAIKREAEMYVAGAEAIMRGTPEPPSGVADG